MNPIFDYDDGEYIYQTSDNMGIDSDGNMYMRISDHMCLDLDTGELHLTSDWEEDDEG